MSIEKMQETLLNLSEAVSKELTIIIQKEHPIPLMLHISSNTVLKELVPRISNRQMPAEDRTLPRICAAPTLYGCILGYQTIGSDYEHNTQVKIDEKGLITDEQGWRNGYTIYSIPYEYALRPSAKLVPDAQYSDEMWLTNYSPETKAYYPQAIGKMFATEIRIKSRDQIRPYTQATIFVEINNEQGIHFSKNIKLEKGYWKLEIELGDLQSWRNTSWEKDNEITCYKLEKTEYFAQKRAVANLLGIEDNAPAYLNW